MSVFLLDVNVLVALSWRGHQAHERTQRWFAAHRGKGWATCPFTQAGFVRVVTNPAFSPKAVTPTDAVRALKITLDHAGHRFWTADLSIQEVISANEMRIVGHKQVTDAYLLALALHKNGKLATLDRGIRSLVAKGSREQDQIEVIG